MQKPISIIIPCYNHESFIQACIKSVIEQDYKNIELIIIDDGSKDNSVQKIEEMRVLCEERFEKFKFFHRPNKGLSATLNEALAYSSGVYISIIASDDIMYDATKTTKQIEFLERNPNCVGVFSGAAILKESGELDIVRRGSEKKYHFKDIILNNYQLFSPSATYRLNDIKKTGGYKNGIILEDWYMFLKLTQNGGYLYALNPAFIGYRRHQSNTSNNTGLLHSDRYKILSLFKESKYYEEAKHALLYTIGVESVTFDKKCTITNLIKVLFKQPSVFFQKRTFITLIKLLIPKKNLNKRLYGKQQ